MEYTYRMTGTLEELQEILQSQFGMNEDAARFSVSLLIKDQQHTVDGLNETQSALWYLNRREQFATPIFKTRFSISFTDVQKEILEQLAVQFAGILFIGEKSVFTTILGCLLAVYHSGTHIKPEECCVYYQALNWKAMHDSQEYFHIQDILPVCFEGICLHLDHIKDKKWKCESCRTEMCGATIDSFATVLKGLCDRKVFTEYNGMYRFVK